MTERVIVSAMMMVDATARQRKGQAMSDLIHRVMIHEKCQKSRGSSGGGFGGPDRYVAVTVAPPGVITPQSLNGEVLAKRGIKILWCGEGYSRRQKTDASMLNRARAEGRRVAAIAREAISVGLL